MSEQRLSVHRTGAWSVKPSETHLNFYQVDNEDFDNEVYSYEVEACNDEEAALKAEELFNGDIYTMYVYLM